MKNIGLLVVFIALLFSCKNREARVFDYTQKYNQYVQTVSFPTLKQTKAYYLNKDRINLDFILNAKEETLKEPSVSNLNGVLDQINKELPQIKDLLKENVNIAIRIYNGFGIKIKEIHLDKNNGDRIDLKKLIQ